jgi:hypothetical protein
MRVQPGFNIRRGSERASCPGASSLSAPGRYVKLLPDHLSFGFQKIGLGGSNLNQLDQSNCFRCSGFGVSRLKSGGQVDNRRPDDLTNSRSVDERRGLATAFVFDGF